MSQLRERAHQAAVLELVGDEPRFDFDTNMHGCVVVPVRNLTALLSLASQLHCADDFMCLVARREELDRQAAGQLKLVEWKRSHHAGTWHEPQAWITLSQFLSLPSEVQ